MIFAQKLCSFWTEHFCFGGVLGQHLSVKWGRGGTFSRIKPVVADFPGFPHHVIYKGGPLDGIYQPNMGLCNRRHPHDPIVHPCKSCICVAKLLHPLVYQSPYQKGELAGCRSMYDMLTRNHMHVFHRETRWSTWWVIGWWPIPPTKPHYSVENH